LTQFLGFYNTATTRTHVRFAFSTHAQTGANVAPLSAFEAADLRIYKATDGAAISDTQRTSSSGITMTSPFDSTTGVHAVDIDLTDNTHAGFYAAGCYYEVWLVPDETIDGLTISQCVARFEIGVAKADVTQWSGTAVASPDTAGYPKVTIKSGTGTGEIALSSGTTLVGLVSASGITSSSFQSGALDAVWSTASRTLTGGDKRWLYVTKSGSDLNSGFSYSAAKLTIAGALAIARNYDTILIAAGTYTETVDVDTANLSNLTIQGEGADVTIITATVTGFFGVVTAENGLTLRDVKVTTATSDGTAVQAINKSNVTLERCDLLGDWDCVFCGYGVAVPYNFRAIDCRMTSTGDVLNLAGAANFLVENCLLITDSTMATPSIQHTHGIIASDNTNPTTGLVRNSRIYVRRGAAYAATSSYKCAALGVGGTGSHITVENSILDAASTHATDTGEVRGIASHPTSPVACRVTLKGTQIITASTAGTPYDIDASATGSKVEVDAASRYDSSKLTGASNIVTGLVPTTAGRTLDVTSTGAAGVDWGNVENKTTTNDLTSTTISTSQVVVAAEDTISPVNVDRDHTWKFDSPSQTTSPNTITEIIGFAGLVCMDFTEPMPARSAISSITSATFANISGTEPTVTSSALTTNKKGVNVLLDCASATANTYTLSVKIVTTDSQTFVRSGRITIT
jgi:hypothetical protein